MAEIKKEAVPVPSVGADGEQQQMTSTSTSMIPTTPEKVNQDNDCPLILEEMYREMQRMNAPGYMHTVTLNQLYDSVYQGRPPVIDGLLCAGTYLFAGAPKVGKSFFMAQLAYHVSTGQKLWDYEVIRARCCISRWRMIISGFRSGCSVCSAWKARTSCTSRCTLNNWETALTNS